MNKERNSLSFLVSLIAVFLFSTALTPEVKAYPIFAQQN